MTHALLPGSPAIDAGDHNFNPPPDFDQRGPGFPRVVNGRIDIGAFEVQPAAPCITLVTTTADSGPGSLRAALACASDGDTIDATGIFGTILLTSGELLVTNNLTILGPGPANLAVDGNAASRVFHIFPSNTVTISSLTITNGFAFGPVPVSDAGVLPFTKPV